MKNTLSLAQELISIKSDPDNTKALEQILKRALLPLRDYTIERFQHNGVNSALVYNTKKRPRTFKILFNAHLDVIPGKDRQYKPYTNKNKLYGVGALDMKSNAACMIMVFKELASKVDYPLAIQLVTDEEVGGHNGTKYQVQKGVRADFVIAGETTNFDIVNKAKGVLWIKISAKGKTAHGAYPWNGENAIFKMSRFLNVLEKNYPTPKKNEWVTTINLSRIVTNNQSFNKIPDNCEAWLDIRFIPEDKDIILANLRKILPKGFKLQVIINDPAKLVDENNPYIALLQKISKKNLKKNIILRGANGSSDARHFSEVNCDGIEFGPIGGGIGSDNEWIDIKSLESYYNILKNFLLSLS